MAKNKTPSETKIESIRHKDKRKNIPTEELRDFIADDEAAPKTMLYPRDPSLDPQLVNGKVTVEIKGLDVYAPTTGQIRNSSTDDIACWFIDTDYNGESSFVRPPTSWAPTTHTRPSRRRSKPRSTRKPGQASTATHPARFTNRTQAGSP